MALSADAGGALRLWGLADGAEEAAVWGGTGSGPVTAACSLHEGAFATARGSLVSVWCPRPGTATGLELAAELCVAGGLSSSSPVTGTALASAAKMIAAGCSDGAMLLWRQGSSGSWEQQPALALADGTAVTTLAFASDASLLAGAAGATVGIWCPASGQQLARQALPAAPIALLWTPAQQLLALTPDGILQPLGGLQQIQQKAGPPAAAESAALAIAPTAASGMRVAAATPAARQKKYVRFAEALQASTEGRTVPLPHRLRGDREFPPPPLPSHPLLHTSRGGSRSTSPVRTPMRRASFATRGLQQPDSAPQAPATTLPVRRLSEVKPIYPILDLRAMRGLQAAAPAPAAVAADASGYSMEHPGELQQPALAHGPASSPALACTAQGSVSSLPAQQQASPAAAPVAQPAAPASAEQPATSADEEERPLQLSLPNPVQRQPPSPPSAGQTSSQRCHTCTAAGEAGSSGPASPAKQALQGGVLEAAAASEKLPALLDASVSVDEGSAAPKVSSARPVSPIKVGVVCTRAAQQQGELQPKEVQLHTGERKRQGAACPHPAHYVLQQSAQHMCIIGTCMKNRLRLRALMLPLRLQCWSWTPRCRCLRRGGSALPACLASAHASGELVSVPLWERRHSRHIRLMTRGTPAQNSLLRRQLQQKQQQRSQLQHRSQRQQQ